MFPPPDEQFVECSDEESPPADTLHNHFDVPRCSEAGYQRWARALHLVTGMLSNWRREVQLVAAIPVPFEGSRIEADLLAHLADEGRGPLGSTLASFYGVSTAFLQLAYPWLQTPGARALPRSLETPDGVLAGMLARGALMDGAYYSIAGTAPQGVTGVYPILRRDQMLRETTDTARGQGATHSFVQRVSTFAIVPDGVSLISDVTTSLQEAYRHAATNRLVATIIRAARLIGEDAVFEANGEALWARVERSMTNLMLAFLQAGVLTGATTQEAFQVRCDRSTMTQNDLDNGRLVCVIEFSAALSIERITVVLSMEEGGRVSLVGGGVAA